MTIYWLTFFVAFFSYHFSFAVNTRIVAFLLKGVAIIVPSLVAAFRDLDVGTDVATYGLKIFDLAIASSSLMNPLEIFRYQTVEIGYIWINLLVSYFSSSYHVLFFVLQFVVLLLTVIGCELLKKYLKQPQWFYLLYLLLNYCMSLSMLRQSIAMAVFIIAIRFLLDRKFLAYSIMVFIGFLFHKSIFFVYPLYFVPSLITKFPKAPWYAIVGCGGLGLYMFFPALLPLGISVGLIDSKFIRYAGGEFNTHKNNMFFFAMTFLYFLYFFKTTYLSFDSQKKKILVCSLSLCAFMVELCGVYNDVASRVTKYFFLLIMVLWFDFFPAFLDKSKINKHLILLIAFMFVFFIYNAQSSRGLVNTIPYRSVILGL